VRGAEAFRTFYDAARAEWPLFPSNPVILSVSTPNGAECRGVDTNGRPVFWIDPNYVITDIIGFHECGHSFEALLAWRGVSVDRQRTLLWQFRQWAGTWQQQDAYARTKTGKEQWDNLPVEIVAESWRVGHMGPPSSERTAYLGPTDYAVRGFYESLQQEAGVAQTDYPGAIWQGSPNYWRGRAYGPPQYIVDHWTVINAANTIAAFTRVSSGVSAHYQVRRSGLVDQFVREGDTAWHDGYDPDGYGPLPGWNHISIGIEHEHELGQDWPQVQLEASARLHQDIQRRRGIPLTREHVLGHRETGYATACPGDLPIDRIIEEDDMFTDSDRTKLDRIYAMTNAEGPRIWTQRLQDWLSKVFKSFPAYARPTDFTGPDVTTNLPRT
jgi:hypothetical protein